MAHPVISSNSAPGSSSWLLLLAFLLSCILTPVPGSAEDAASAAERWLPDPDTVSIAVETRNSGTYATVKIMAPSPNHVMRHWGEPGLRVNAFPVVRPASVLPVVTELEHSYDLGELRPGRYVFVFACWGEPVKREAFRVPRPDDDDDDAAWQRWMPDPDTVSIAVETRNSGTYARVTVMAPSSNHLIRDWGEPGLRVNARPVLREGIGLPVVTELKHTYALGELRPGRYVFVFACWGEPVKRQTFRVPSPAPPEEPDPGPEPEPDPERWLPRPDDVSIAIEERASGTHARVTVMAPSSNHVIRDWGEPGLRVDAKPVLREGIGLPVVTPLEHTYRLGGLEPGEHTFIFACWGEPIARESFLVPTPRPEAARAEGDFTGDGCVGLPDFLYVLENWGLKLDEEPVGLTDFLAVLSNWDEGC